MTRASVVEGLAFARAFGIAGLIAEWEAELARWDREAAPTMEVP